MINPVTSSAIASQQPENTHVKPQAAPPPAPKQDSVQLSDAAKAATKSAGDVDHDGDSH